MSRKTSKKVAQQDIAGISKQDYRTALHALQIELVKLQRHFIRCDDKILVLLEGRDAAGKDGVIKRIVQHLSPRETRVVALGKPGTSSATSRTFPRGRSSSCSIAAGTTGPASSG
jgi:polyphosphate kinase 2 (PPK2 family)